jgi:hypothetical protein
MKGLYRTEQQQTAKHSNVISIRDSVKALTLNGVNGFQLEPGGRFTGTDKMHHRAAEIPSQI